MEITIFLIAIQASIGFVNGLGIFDESYYATQNNTWTNYEVSDLGDYQTLAEDPGILDYASLAASTAWEGFWMIMRILFAIVLIFPILIEVFEVPTGIAALLQVMIYIVYYISWADRKSGRDNI